MVGGVCHRVAEKGVFYACKTKWWTSGLQVGGFDENSPCYDQIRGMFTTIEILKLEIQLSIPKPSTCDATLCVNIYTRVYIYILHIICFPLTLPLTYIT